MKKLLVFITLLVIMAITNPSKGDYVAWLKEEIKQSSSQLVGFGVDLLGDSIINNSTSSDDYVIFSVYETDFMGDSVTVVGVFNNFFTLPPKDSTTQSEAAPTTTKQLEVESSSSKQISEPIVENKYVQSVEEITAPLERLLITSNTPLSTNSWATGENDRQLPIKFTDQVAVLYFGQDHPNGIKLLFSYENVNRQLIIENPGVLDDLGEFIGPSYSLQVASYDFNEDNNDEVVIAIGDGFSNGEYFVYSYYQVEDLERQEPLVLETTGSFQSKIVLENNKVVVPIGSQGYFEEDVVF